jgi:hypothetical protein
MQVRAITREERPTPCRISPCLISHRRPPRLHLRVVMCASLAVIVSGRHRADHRRPDGRKTRGRRIWLRRTSRVHGMQCSSCFPIFCAPTCRNALP